jgi:hypothetical protein
MLLVAVLASAPFDAVPGGTREALQGLNEFRVVIEDLDDEARSCGIQASEVETAIRFILQQSRIRTTTALSKHGFVYANLMVLGG